MTRASCEIRLELVTATTAAAATAAAAVFTTRATTATAAAAGRTLFARARDIDRQIATIHRGAVEGFDGLLRFLGGAHRHETEPARAAADAVDHQVRFHDGAVRSEHILEIILRGVEGKISNKQFVTHVMLLS